MFKSSRLDRPGFIDELKFLKRILGYIEYILRGYFPFSYHFYNTNNLFYFYGLNIQIFASYCISQY